MFFCHKTEGHILSSSYCIASGTVAAPDMRTHPHFGGKSDAHLLQVFDSSFQSRRVGGGITSGGGGCGVVPAFALGLSTTGLLEPTRVVDEHQVDPGKEPKGEVRSAVLMYSVCSYRLCQNSR